MIKKALIQAGESRVRCNIGHSGNHRLTYDAGYFQCNGCGHFHCPADVASTLAGSVEDWTGTGGLILTREVTP